MGLGCSFQFKYQVPALNILQLLITVLSSSFSQSMEYTYANLLTESTVTLIPMQFYFSWERDVYMLICSPCVLLALCLFVALDDFQFRFEGKLWLSLLQFPIIVTSFHTVRTCLQICLFIYI